jgi:1-acyl-sn-glycerol-3-phosphate acyltransferase
VRTRRRNAAGLLAATLAKHYLASLQIAMHWTGSDGSRFVIANHQATIDVPVAAEVSHRLGFRFATWAHPEIVRRIPILRRLDFLEASSEPAAFRQLIADTRMIARRSGQPTFVWIFPEGQFGHSLTPMRLQAGVLAAFRACPEVKVVTAGIHYSLFRRARPHCTVFMTESRGIRSTQELEISLESARKTAQKLSGNVLPGIIPPLGSRPAPWGQEWFQLVGVTGRRSTTTQDADP